MRSLKNYTVVLRPDDNGTFVAYLPAIAGCHAWGQTIEEAQAGLIQVFEMIRDEYEEAGQELPEDVDVAVTHAAKAKEIERAARKLGFEKVRQKGSHARWKHPDGRATTIPIHGNAEIGS